MLARKTKTPRTGRRVMTPDSFKQALHEKHKHLRFKSKDFLGVMKLHTFLCTVCNSEYEARPAYVMKLQNGGCAVCKTRVQSRTQMLAREEVTKRIAEKHGTKVRLLGQFRGVGRIHRFKCLTCMKTWKMQLKHVMGGVSCTHCRGTHGSGRYRNSGRFKMKEVTLQGITVQVQGYEPQALQWLLEYRNVKMKDVAVDSSGNVPVIPYRIGRRNHHYYPDIYIPKFKRIVEVKSSYTLGMLTGRQWKKNQAKAKACIESGYKFTLMVMGGDGQRWWIPHNWYDLDRKQVVMHCLFNNADHTPTKRRTFKRNLALK